jgi:hypothetical protein
MMILVAHRCRPLESTTSFITFFFPIIKTTYTSQWLGLGNRHDFVRTCKQTAADHTGEQRVLRLLLLEECVQLADVAEDVNRARTLCPSGRASTVSAHAQRLPFSDGDPAIRTSVSSRPQNHVRRAAAADAPTGSRPRR